MAEPENEWALFEDEQDRIVPCENQMNHDTDVFGPAHLGSGYSQTNFGTNQPCFSHTMSN